MGCCLWDYRTESATTENDLAAAAELYPTAVALPGGSGYILTEKLHLQRLFKGAQTCIWVCFSCCPPEVCITLPKLKLHFHELFSLNFSNSFPCVALCKPGYERNPGRFGRWRCGRCLVSVEGGGRLRFCCSSHWRVSGLMIALEPWTSMQRWGWGDGEQCLTPAPGSSSLNFS